VNIMDRFSPVPADIRQQPNLGSMPGFEQLLSPGVLSKLIEVGQRFVNQYMMPNQNTEPPDPFEAISQAASNPGALDSLEKYLKGTKMMYEARFGPIKPPTAADGGGRRARQRPMGGARPPSIGGANSGGRNPAAVPTMPPIVRPGGGRGVPGQAPPMSGPAARPMIGGMPNTMGGQNASLAALLQGIGGQAGAQVGLEEQPEAGQQNMGGIRDLIAAITQGPGGPAANRLNTPLLSMLLRGGRV
jgi:hypothetical protein